MVTNICDFQHKSYYNLAQMHARNRGFSGSADLTVSLKLCSDDPCCHANENLTNFNRIHENTAAKLCKRILGYDANALYLSTMLNDMPRGKEKMTDYKDPVQKAIELKNAIISGKLFGFVKCKLATPKTLWAKFEEMPPIFVNREVPEAAVSKDMLDYLTRTGRKRTTGKKLLGVLEADEILLYTPLHGLSIR